MNSKEMADPVSMIAMAPAGKAIYGRVGESADSLRTSILIQEEMKYIKGLRTNPIVEIRSGLFDYSGIGLVAVMFKFNHDDDMIYETWWNYYQTGGGEKYFTDICQSPDLDLHIFCGQEKVKSVRIYNSLKEPFMQKVVYLKSRKEWSMADFDRERENLYRKYPTVKELWDICGTEGIIRN